MSGEVGRRGLTLILAGALLLAATACLGAELAEFSSDGCSRFPDGTPWQQDVWLDCCMRHDLAYWIGGTPSDREEADLTLRQCVAGVGEVAIAELMLAGVRVGGSPYFPTSYRWGYGWPYPRGYREPDAHEAELLDRARRRVPQLQGDGARSVPALWRLIQRYGLAEPAL